MSRFVAMASLITVLAPSVPVGAGPCLEQDLMTRIATREGTVIEDGGGVLVGVGWTGERSASADHLTNPDWRFRDGGKLVIPTIDKLAPGLAVYRLPASRTQSYTLESGTHAPLVTVRRSSDRDAPRLPAPMPTGAEQTTEVGPRERTDVITVHLIATPPRGAVNLVVYGRDGIARSFGLVDPAANEVEVYRSPGNCGNLSGEIATRAGDTVTVAWLDRSGRLSAKSRPIEIAAGKTR